MQEKDSVGMAISKYVTDVLASLGTPTTVGH